MQDLKKLEIWFVTGSQHLYGEETLNQVAANSKQIAKALDSASQIPVQVIFKPTVKTPEEIAAVCRDANMSKTCIGIITWMHTFSPAKMWINGLKILQKPLLHLHTQFNRDIPWSTIDMDFMNLNQIRPRRPRVWVYHDPHEEKKKSSGGPLAGSIGAG